MKRGGRSAPLFRDAEPAVYVIDTSAWLNIDARRDAEDVWALITKLIQRGRIVACAPVLAELQSDDLYAKRFKPFEQALSAGDRPGDDIDYLQHVGRVTHQHPGLCKATGRKTRADPYVIALAELEGYVVVCDETVRRTPNRKIPGVCATRRLRCLTLVEFLAEVRAEAGATGQIN